MLDLSQVGHLDSSGVAVLIDFQKRLAAAGGALTLVAPRLRVGHVLRLMGPVQLFDVSATVEAVTGDVGRSQPASNATAAAVAEFTA